jgi:phosphate transport system protein
MLIADMSVWLREGLNEVEASLRAEAELVRRSIRDAVAAFAHHDVALADVVVAADDAVDEVYLRVEEQVQALLARQQPVAIDLRRALAALHVNVHLERIADYCVTIAKLARLVANLAVDEQLERGFEEMGLRAEEIVGAAVDCFLTEDVTAAEQLVEQDEAIDSANRQVVQRVLTLTTDESKHEWGLRLILTSRCLERIGDHAVDIGEMTAYLVTGQFREFTDASHHRELETAAPAPGP